MKDGRAYEKLKNSSTQTLLYYESLDFLKGIAILMVIIVHTSQRVIMPQGYSNIAMLEQLGCQIFFVISGFSLSSSLVHNHLLGCFYWNRFISIAPGCYIAIIISILVPFLEIKIGVEPIAELSGEG